MDGKGQARKKSREKRPIERCTEQEKYKTGRFNRTDVNKRKINEEKNFLKIEKIGFISRVMAFRAKISLISRLQIEYNRLQVNLSGSWVPD